MQAGDEGGLFFLSGVGGYHADGFAGGGVNQHGLIRVPHVAQTLVHAALGVGGVRGAHGEHAHQQDDGHDEEYRHAPLAEPFDTLAHAAVDEPEVGHQCQQEEDGGAGLTAEEVAICTHAHEVGKEVTIGLRGV